MFHFLTTYKQYMIGHVKPSGRLYHCLSHPCSSCLLNLSILQLKKKKKKMDYIKILLTLLSLMLHENNK